MIRIGSRGSQLALWQANHIASLLRAQGHEVAIATITTTGDRLQAVPFARVGSKGMFTKEIEEALAEGAIDLAVHSLKDLPTELDARFVIAAVTERMDPRDVFVSIHYNSMAELPKGARVGTSSLRRQSQLRARWPGVEYVELRGNVDTRLRKLSEAQVDAAVLAAAGLDRLERTEWVRERFSADVLCPAPGQGALAIECRTADERTRAALTILDHAESRFAVTAERVALAALGGGCQVPIGAYCRRDGNQYRISGCVSSPDGATVLRAEERGTDAESLGAGLADSLLKQGALQLLAQQGNVK
ncbi:MAG TPA: hydroxymethylbilane synthase [Acidobacteriaceae bacterium]